LAAWISLVLITGITAFMLNPGNWPNDRTFWTGFLNPQFIPQVVARTGGALLLTSLYVYLHASLTLKSSDLRELISRRSIRPALLGAILITVGGAGWYMTLPPSAIAVMPTAAVLNVLIVLIFAMTLVVFAALYFGPYQNPSWLSPGFAALMLLFGFGAIMTGEFIREAVRKPFVVYNVVMSNQILPEEIPKFQKAGILAGGTWTKAYVADAYPELLKDDQLDKEVLAALDHKDRLELGRVLFLYHCNDCHAGSDGYSAVGPLIRGRSPRMIRDMVLHFKETHFYMPPWCGTPEEAQLLAEYLASIAPPDPEGIIYDETDKEAK
jgi:mono/diheme cytochrome c family protein